MCDPVTIAIAAGAALATAGTKAAIDGNRVHNRNVKNDAAAAQRAAALSSNTLKTPTSADASVTKAGDAERTRAAILASQNIKTTARGLGTSATTTKKTLLGI